MTWRLFENCMTKGCKMRLTTLFGTIFEYRTITDLAEVGCSISDLSEKNPSTAEQVDSPHKEPVMQKAFPCNDVIVEMWLSVYRSQCILKIASHEHI